MKNKGIHIAVLNQGNVRPELSDLLLRLDKQNKYRITVSYPAKKPITLNRNSICKKFLETDFDYLLMMDGDCPPMVNAQRLLDMADYDKDIIGGVCFGFINNMINPFVMKRRADYRYDMVNTNINSGVVEVDAIGSGNMMIARRVLEKLPFPFRNEYDPEGIKTKGLDFNFCRRAKDLGYKVWCDTDMLVSHWTTIDLLKMWKTFNELARAIKKLNKELTDSYNNNIDGWMLPEQLGWLFNAAKEMKSIVEIGSWKGKSTHALLTGCKGTVHAVDIFNGSMKKDVSGDEQYEEFMRNVGHFKNLEIYRMPSAEAVKKFKDKSIDMVFIDGGHTYEEVKQDIEMWLPKTKKLICGHDYQGADVKKAVDEKFKNVDCVDNIWFKVL